MSRTPDQRCRQLAARQEGLIRRDQALDCGMHASSIDRRTVNGDWIVVLPRIYSVGGPLTWDRKLRATALWAGTRSAISHQAAAAWWRMAEFPPGPLVVTTERSLKPPPGARVHRVRSFGPADVTVHEGVSVTTPPRTLLDVAALAPKEAVEAAVDDALRTGLVSLPKLRWFVQTHGGRGRAGTAMMRRMLAERAGDYVAVESTLERKVWNLIVGSGLPRPVRQHRITDGGKPVARVDFAYPGALVAVEVDGYRWHSGRRAWSRDLTRRNRLTALGWRVLHVTHDDLMERPDHVVEQIDAALSGGRLSLYPR